MHTPASVANKRLSLVLTPLDATLTKNRGVGSGAAFLSSSTDLPPLSFHILTNCNSSNPFVLISCKLMRGWGVRPWLGPLIPHFATRQILVILKRTDKVRGRILPPTSSRAVV